MIAIPAPTTRLHPDRRGSDRVIPHVCDCCDSNQHVSAVSRTSDIVYFRCHQCGHVFSMWKTAVHFAPQTRKP